MMRSAVRIDPKSAQFGDDFAANRAGLPGAGLAWLDARRAKAMEAFASVGVPHRRVESWKYSDLASALEAKLEPAAPLRGPIDADLLADPFAGVPGKRLLLIDGFLSDAGELPAGVDVADLSGLNASAPDWVQTHFGVMAVGADQPLGAASLALMRGGVVIRVRKNADVTLSLAFAHTLRAANSAEHIRVLIVVEEGASLLLLESHTGGTGTGQLLVNLGMELVLDQNARLEHIRLQPQLPSIVHIDSVGGRVDRDARYSGLFVALGAKLARLDMNIKLNGAGAEAVLHGVAALARDAHADVTTVMDHAHPNTTSRQLFKSVLGANTRSVIQGKVLVREGAVKSDSHQLFKALLMAERAEADAKPELEIFADDVICGHGTAIGALDEDSLFYLRARGIPEGEAHSMLVRAFLDDALAGFAGDAVHDALWRVLDPIVAGLDGVTT